MKARQTFGGSEPLPSRIEQVALPLRLIFQIDNEAGFLPVSQRRGRPFTETQPAVLLHWGSSPDLLMPSKAASRRTFPIGTEPQTLGAAMSKVEGNRPKTGGRKKGTPNKTTGMAKDAIALAADRLGGVSRLVAWAQAEPANERVFWGQIYTKLLPLQIAGDPDNPIPVTFQTVYEQRAKD